MAIPDPCCTPLGVGSMSDREARSAAELFKAMGDPARVKIVNTLATSDVPVCVCELTAELGLAQPTVSHHLKKLANAGLLRRERRGTWSYYTLDPAATVRLATLTGLHGGESMSTTTDALRDEVRERYAEAARVAEGGGCGCEEDGGCCGNIACAGGEGSFGRALYSDGECAELPDAAVLASLGCGNPTAVAELHKGETVLDFGSGGGIDVILSARRVGASGMAYGLDMTDEMLAIARRNAAEAGVPNVHFLKGHIEAIPLPAESVDVVISNCVINLSVDKPAVLREMARVLVPGGRIGVSDVVAENRLSAAERAERGSYTGCIAGALSQGEYEAGLAAAGFEDVSVAFTHEVTDGLHGAIVRARKPVAGAGSG